MNNWFKGFPPAVERKRHFANGVTRLNRFPHWGQRKTYHHWLRGMQCADTLAWFCCLTSAMAAYSSRLERSCLTQCMKSLVKVRLFCLAIKDIHWLNHLPPLPPPLSLPVFQQNLFKWMRGNHAFMENSLTVVRKQLWPCLKICAYYNCILLTILIRTLYICSTYMTITIRPL